MNITGDEIAGYSCEVIKYNLASRPIILFIHGMGLSAWSFHNWMQVFYRNGYDCIALNLPGHCGSSGISRPDNLSIRDYVYAVEQVLQAIGSATVIGHSMGGLIVQKVLSNGASLNTEKAVLVNPVPPQGFFLQGLAFRRLFRMTSKDGLFPYFRAMCTGKAFSLTCQDIRDLTLNDLDDREAYVDRFSAESGRAVREMFWGSISVNSGLAEHTPILLVTGKKDKLTPPSLGRKLVQMHEIDPDNWLELEGGHMPMLGEGQEEAAELVLDHLNQMGNTKRMSA